MMNQRQIDLSMQLISCPGSKLMWAHGMFDADPSDDGSYPDLTHSGTQGHLLAMMWAASPYVHLTGSEMAGFDISLPDFMFPCKERHLYSKCLGEVAAEALVRLWARGMCTIVQPSES